MTVRGILFDYGGTLVNEAMGVAPSLLKRLLDEAGVPYNAALLAESPQVFDDFWKERFSEYPRGERWNDAIQTQCLAAVFANLEIPDQFRTSLRHVATQWLHATRRVADPKAPAILQELDRKGLRLGVLSQTLLSADAMEVKLREGGLVPPISHVFTSESLELDKPDPELYRRAAERFGLQPSEICMVGNNLEMDILPAREVGMHALLLDKEGRLHPPEGVTSISYLEGVLVHF